MFKNQLYFHILPMNDLKIKLNKHIITSKRIRYIGMYLANELHDLYNEN